VLKAINSAANVTPTGFNFGVRAGPSAKLATIFLQIKPKLFTQSGFDAFVHAFFQPKPIADACLASGRHNLANVL
jgi:hypothetical protein